jgi:hypothetical protein
VTLHCQLSMLLVRFPGCFRHIVVILSHVFCQWASAFSVARCPRIMGELLIAVHACIS